MKISENTVAEIVKRGDAATMYEILRALIRTLNDRENRLRTQDEASARMGTLFVKTESERDRYRRMAEELHSLCKEAGSGEKADIIVGRLGGFGNLRPTAEMEINLET
ncbi:MAG TPA: hypothetical protein VMW69_08400 [Spirochaetia bacterium]|nr:hypothetical protein [Spirochaetia bacterium]